jgi:transcriptional regulator
MYQPAHRRFAVTDPAALLSGLAEVSPATLVLHGPAGFSTSILPMLFDPSDGPNGTLRGHLARPNPQWAGAADGPVEAVAIFHGPDAYVSPGWYEEKARTGRVVPTWNYVVVIAQGTIVVHTDEAWLLEHVRALVDRHEARFPEPWSIDDAPDGYIRGQAKGIVGLELRITRLEAKRKLGQNRSAADIAGAIEGLGSGTPMERAVAEAMRIPEGPVLHSRPHGGDREE